MINCFLSIDSSTKVSMKRIYSIASTLAFAILCSSCSSLQIAPTTAQDPSLVMSLRDATRSLSLGRKNDAFLALHLGKTVAEKRGEPIPEYYRELTKMTAERSVEDTIWKIRVHYSKSEFREVMKLVEIAFFAIRAESLPVPYTLERIVRKLGNGIQETPLFNFTLPKTKSES